MIFFPLLALLFGYVVIAGFITYFIGRRFATAKAKAIAMIVLALVFVAIPTADHAVGYVVFKHYCEAEAGTKIYRTVENVEGFRDEYVAFGRDSKIFRDGYRFVERDINGERLRISMSQNLTLVREGEFAPKSKYTLKHALTEPQFFIAKEQYFVEDLQSSQVIAQRTELWFRGGWVAQMLGQLGSGNPFCPIDEFSVTEFVRAVLKPIDAKEPKGSG